MVSQSDSKRVGEFLKANNYLELYIFLISSSDNLGNRAVLLSEDLRQFEGKIQEILAKVSANPDVFVPENRGVSKLFKQIHYIQLEIIQRINILIELLAIYHHTIRTDLRGLPKIIGRKDFSSRELYNEFNYFKNQKLTDIWTNFKYPNVSHFTELSIQEQSFLNELLMQSARNISNAFNWIYQFQKNFRPVYNKYKHTLSEFTGIFGIDKLRKQVQSYIFLRDKENERVHSYMIPSASEEVVYLNEVAARTFRLLRVLIDNTLLHLVNEEKDFLPRTLFIDKEKGGKFKELTKKIQSCIIPNFTSKMVVKPPNKKEVEKVNEKLRKHHIHRMNKDILDLENLLREGVTFSKS